MVVNALSLKRVTYGRMEKNNLGEMDEYWTPIFKCHPAIDLSFTHTHEL
jgi:hypothetical protein